MIPRQLIGVDVEHAIVAVDTTERASMFQAASQWKDAYSSTLIESAISHGATEWAWIEHRHGVLEAAGVPLRDDDPTAGGAHQRREVA